MDRSLAPDLDTPGESRNGGVFTLVALPLGHLVNDWPGGALWLLAPAMALSLDLTPAEVGLLLALHSGGASLAYLPAGMVGDRVRNRGLLLTTTFWWVAIGYYLATFAPDFWTLALLLAFAGLGDAAWHPIAAAVMVEQKPSRRAQLIGVHAIGGTFAEVGGPLCAGFLLSLYSWETVLSFSVIPAAVMAVVFLKLGARVPRSTQPIATRHDYLSLIQVWRQPGSLTLIAIISCYNMAHMGALAMVPLFVQRVHDYTAAQAGVLFAVAFLLGAAAQPLLGQVSDVIGRKRISLVALVLASAFFLAVFATESGIWAGVFLVLAVGLLAGIRSVLLAAMVDRSGHRASTTLGLAFSIMDGVGAFGAWFAGLAAATELHHAFIFTAGMAMVAAILAARHTFAGNQTVTHVSG